MTYFRKLLVITIFSFILLNINDSIFSLTIRVIIVITAYLIFFFKIFRKELIKSDNKND